MRRPLSVPVVDTGPRPIRVVHLITDLDVGGAEMALTRLLAALDRDAFENAVISLTSGGRLKNEIENLGVPVFEIGLHSPLSALPAVWRLFTLLRRLQPVVLQTWLYHADLAGLMLARVARVPHLVWNIRCAELEPSDHPWTLRLIRTILARTSRVPAGVIANADSGRRAHESVGYRPRRWHIIPNGFDVSMFGATPPARAEVRQELDLAADVPLVGLIARLHPMKDHATFLRAAARVAAARPAARFVMAGRGVDRDHSLLALARSLGIESRVYRLGERNDVARLLSALDVSVCSSYGEAFPNIVAESMAAGVPCVATDVGDVAAILGNCGAVVPPRDPDSLAQAILAALDVDPGTHQRVAAAARARIQAEFSLQRCAARYERVYAELSAAATVRDTALCVE